MAKIPMKKGVILSLIGTLFFVSVSSESNNTGSRGGEMATEKQELISPNTSLPDTASWIALLEKTTGLSLRHGRKLCIRLIQSHGRNVTGKQNVYVSNIYTIKQGFMGYRYTVLLNNSSEEKAQLESFRKAGFLDAENGTYEGQPAIIYRLTTKGWAESPIGSSFSNSLCYETGKYVVSRILDYSLLNDQGSGLKAYKVTYEVEYRLGAWVNAKVLKAFDQMRQVPQQLQAVLIKGPSGYFNPNPARHSGPYHNLKILSTDEIVLIISSDTDFLKHLTTMTGQTAGVIKNNLVVNSAKSSGYGEGIVFRFSFKGTDGVTKYGRGLFHRYPGRGWILDKSFTLMDGGR